MPTATHYVAIDMDCRSVVFDTPMPNRSRSHALRQQEFQAAPPVSTLLARKQELVRDAIWNAAVDLAERVGFVRVQADSSLPDLFSAGTSKSRELLMRVRLAPL